jgi:hypothetical protein
MTRLRFKLAYLLIAFAFQAAAFTEALQLRECPHHDALPAAAMGVGDQAADEGGGHAEHGPDGEGHEGHGACTCVSVCDLGPSTTALLPGAIVFSSVDASTSATVVDGARDAQLPGPADHLHPFPLGPPPAALI